MSLFPAVIRSYDAGRRRVRIEMVGLTDGDKLLPEAELMYSLGDNSSKTEIEINTGDLVWIDFIANDHRYPVIMGYRNPETGNLNGLRKFHHANIMLEATGTITLKCANLVIDTGSTKQSGTVAMEGAVSMASSLAVAGELSNGGVNVGKTHKHNENGDGGGVTDDPH